MYQTISKDRSLFFIDSHHVDSFIALADAVWVEDMPFIPKLLNIEHTWTSIFNIWLLLQPDEALIVEAFDKSMYYSSNQLLIKALKNDYHFNFLRTTAANTPEQLFIGAIFINNGISSWTADLMTQEGLDDVLNDFQQSNYYDLHNSPLSEVTPFINNQARLVKLLAANLNATPKFSRMIKKQCDEAIFYYRDHYLLKKA